MHKLSCKYLDFNYFLVSATIETTKASTLDFKTWRVASVNAGFKGSFGNLSKPFAEELKLNITCWLTQSVSYKVGSCHPAGLPLSSY